MKPSVRFLSTGQFLARQGFLHQKRRLDNNTLLLCILVELNIQEEQAFTLRRGDAVILRAGYEHVGWKVSSILTDTGFHIKEGFGWYYKTSVETGTELIFVCEV